MSRDGSNGFDPEQLEKFLTDIDKADDELLKLASQHMTKCKTPRAKIREVMKSAKESGFKMPAFRTLVAKHRSERKIDEKIAELEADDREDFELMKKALGDFGDTPLGDAALKKAKPPKGGEQLDTLRG